jgi:hypothetical protein
LLRVCISLEQPDVTVDSGSDVKEKVLLSSAAVSYPVTTWAKSSNYSDVVIEYSQVCTAGEVCQLAEVSFSDVPDGATVVFGQGSIVLTGDYDSVNQAMLNLIIAPGAGNPNPIDVMVTATDQDGLTSDFDSFTIPVVSVSSML